MMEDINKIILRVTDADNQLNSELIQEILLTAKRDKNVKNNTELWNKILKVLWTNLCQGYERFDDHLLCAICFYTILSLSEEDQEYLDYIKNAIQNEIIHRKNNSKEGSNKSLIVALMYGIFQSSYLLQQNEKQNGTLGDLLQVIFELLITLAYEFSKYTFIVFKTINSIKKVCGTNLRNYLINEENNLKLLNLVNHNWENPITGVRDMNKSIFQSVISTLDERMFNRVLSEINTFYWNKAKYLMLAEIISQSNKDMIGFLQENKEWIDGIVLSLSKQGLVSAGADMYFAVLKKTRSELEWCSIFMKTFIKILKGDTKKSIENFTNYLCLTTLKSYPSLISKFLKEMGYFKEKDRYTILSLLKQTHKLGLVVDIEDTSEHRGADVEKIVISSLEHSDNQIRIMAFEILCTSQKKTMPSKEEYDLVLSFLRNNINSDCTVLRINMLKSFCSFLTQMHISYLNYFDSAQKTDGDNLKNFSVEFQNFIVSNLKIGGNYQRKITVIKLMQEFLTGITGIPRKRQKQTKHTSKTIGHLLRNEHDWVLSREDIILDLVQLLKDPADDVRENVVQLLLTHYPHELKKKKRMDILIKDALESMSSKFFYEISCGQSMFKLIASILIESKVAATFRSVEDLVTFAFNELLKEYRMKRSTLESIENGKQLHSFISILYIVLETCLQNNCKINIDDKLTETLQVLEEVSNQFAWEQGATTSSDFSKMSDMVQSLITSGYNDSDVSNDETKISGLHQIVLNCLWLNVKASCQLSSLLIRLQTDDTKIKECEKALDIIGHVLETCRHKGAIEAAGTVLGDSIKHLTSLPNNANISKLPFEFLKKKLNQWIQEATRMASITRRGAGLSIMVHRIVSSDAKRGKPLFHYFMNTILETCNRTEAIPRHLIGMENIDNEKDLPKAIYIHFLTRVVTDSSLASDMMFYSANLAELAFGNLASPHWQIRNAALQLYGALNQKLIGQKKAAGSDEEVVATVACDELRTHSPKLWNHIQKQLQITVYDIDDKLQYHSNLVPILNMLANLAKKYNFSLDHSDEANRKLLKNLVALLDSPIYVVRRLTAKCIYNIFNFIDVFQELKEVIKTRVSENFLHGSLTMLAHYDNSQYTEEFQNLRLIFSDTFSSRNCSYLSKEIFEDLFQINVNVDQFEKTLVELQNNHHCPGIDLWAQKRFQKCVLDADWDLIPKLLKIFLSSSQYECYSIYLLEKIEKSQIPETVVLELIEILVEFENLNNSSILWKILYSLSINVDPHCFSEKLHGSVICHCTEKMEINYKLRYKIPLLAKTAAVKGNETLIRNIIKIIDSLTDPETDVEMRYIAAISNNEFGSCIKKMPEESRIIAIKSVIILAQDEDEVVRIKSVEFYQQVLGKTIPVQPYICLVNILSAEFLNNVLSSNGREKLSKELFKFIEKISNKSVDKYNPFANDSNNIYLEVNILNQLIENIHYGSK